MNLIFLFYNLIVFFTSFFLLKLIILYANSINFGDIPNNRSLHKITTPNLGGLPLMVIFLLSLIYFFIQGMIKSDFFYFFFLPTILIFSIGLLDDIKNINFKIRILLHSLAAFLSIYFSEYIDFFKIFNINQSYASFNICLTFVLIIWFINLFNFMDGINGFLGFEFLFFILSFFLIINFNNNTEFNFENLHYIFIILSTLIISFLFLNFPYI